MPYFRVSPGEDLPGRTAIAEASTKRLRADEEKRRIAEEERAYKRQLETEERQREYAEKATQTARLSELERAGTELGLDIPKDPGYRTAVPFSPEQEKLKSYQRYAELPESEKISYLEGQIRPAIKQRAATELEEEASVYGITGAELDKFRTPAGKRKYIADVAKTYEFEKSEQRKKIKKEEEEITRKRDLIAWAANNEGQKFNVGTSREYTLDTGEELIYQLEQMPDIKLTTVDRNEIMAMPWSRRGIDETKRFAQREAWQAEEAGYMPVGEKYVRPPKETIEKDIFRTVGGDLYKRNPETGEFEIAIKKPSKSIENLSEVDLINQYTKFADIYVDPTYDKDPIFNKIKAEMKKKGILGEEKGYTKTQEQLITDNMKAYNKSREEVIGALKRKGHLK